MEKGYKKEEKNQDPAKYWYLNQKVNIPSLYGERMQYIRNIFYDEDLYYTISRAPSTFFHNCIYIGKYFWKELQTIVEIGGGLLSYFSKTIQINLKLQRDKKFIQTLD